MNSPVRHFISRADGTATIEFVAVFLTLIAFVFFVIEATLYMFFTASLEKSAQAAVRTVVVSDPLIAGLPSRNDRAESGEFGQRCSDATAPCVGFATQSCTEGTCDAVGFARVLAHMQGFAGQLEGSNVTVTYTDVALGYAGGPVVPMVTVSVQNVPFETGIIGLLLTDAGVLSGLPPRSASMTAEDLD